MKKIYFFLILFFLFLIGPAKAVAAGRLYLDPASGSYSSGDEFSVAVWVDPGGATVAVDAIINFDATRLEAVSVKDETYFSEAGVHEIDNENGRVSIFAFASTSNTSVSTAGKIATINFKAKAEGTATVSFVCQGGGDDDSSIWDSQQNDLIDCASNGSGSYTIGTAADTPSSTPTPTTASSPESPTATPTQLPETGVETPLIGVMVGGTIILGAGLLLGLF